MKGLRMEIAMTDRELLELAAKAARFSGLTWRNGSACFYYDDPDTGREEWNPLDDDGQALRLAAKLRLLIKPGKYLGDGCTVEAQQAGVTGCTAFRDDASMQMRYAIVHVAAEIGKAMP